MSSLRGRHPRAVIFDMDGLLIDSEPLWVRAEIEVFGRVGLTLADEDCALTKGLRTDDVIGYWYARRPWSGPSPAEVEAMLVARVAELVAAEGAALPGIATALEAARQGGCKVALASSSPTPIIRAALARLGLADTFDAVRSAEREPFGKPHPAIFLTTAATLDVSPLECLVLEDSITGVIAAKAARMSCVAIPVDREDARFAIADAVVASLADVTHEVISAACGTR